MAVVGIALASTNLSAQRFTWQPSAGHIQVPIWPGAAPDQQPVKESEYAEWSGPNDLVAGRQVIAVNDVTRPTMTVYKPTVNSVKAAVVVFPGGGYQILAIDLEGTEVCDWLTTKGITCVLLKYRVTDTGPYPGSGPYPESYMALEDAQRTLGLLRFHANEYGIDPNRIGVLGFSSGGHLAVAASVYWQKRVYKPEDAADAISCRPDFALPIYPGHLDLAAAEWDSKRGMRPYPLRMRRGADKDLTLNPFIHVTKDTPPTFLLQNEDDHEDRVYDALTYFTALVRAGVPAELHVYAKGGHAFGLRRTSLPATWWPELAEIWMRSIGVLR